MPDPRRTPWIAIDVDIRKDDRISDLPSDAARWGYVAGVLAEARLQNPRGAFGSRATFDEAVGRFGKYLDVYISVGLMERAPKLCDRCARAFPELRSGALVVHNWARKQHDPTAAERQRRHREQGDEADDSHADVTPLSRQRHGNVTGYSRARAETQTQTLDTEEDLRGTGVRPRPRAPGRTNGNGSSSSTYLGVEPGDERYPVAQVLEQRYRWTHISDKQWDRIWECVDNEYPAGTSRGADRTVGWRWCAEFLEQLPKKVGPLDALFAETTRRKTERQSEADERIAESEKHKRGRLHPSIGGAS